MELRQQYHFRDSEQGLLAWDVFRLIELSKDLMVKQVPVSVIQELKENYWYGLPGDVPTPESIATHARLISEADLSYPIILCHEGRVMDGMHRACKALIEDREMISVVQFNDPLPPDYVGKMPDELPY